MTSNLHACKFQFCSWLILRAGVFLRRLVPTPPHQNIFPSFLYICLFLSSVYRSSTSVPSSNLQACQTPSTDILFNCLLNFAFLGACGCQRNKSHWSHEWEESVHWLQSFGQETYPGFRRRWKGTLTFCLNLKQCHFSSRFALACRVVAIPLDCPKIQTCISGVPCRIFRKSDHSIH